MFGTDPQKNVFLGWWLYVRWVFGTGLLSGGICPGGICPRTITHTPICNAILHF